MPVSNGDQVKVWTLFMPSYWQMAERQKACIAATELDGVVLEEI
jgi:hypothetical protein